MYNRKFNIKIDFDKINKLENVIKPLIETIPNEKDKEDVMNYVREIFYNQFKKD
jgi:hypothetical protein